MSRRVARVAAMAGAVAAFALAAALPGSGQAVAQPAAAAATRPVADQAYAALQAGRYIEAFRIATRRIGLDSNDAAAMTLLGELFAQGLGVRIDEKRAVEWYELAARRGDGNARFALAMMLLRGRGVERDPVRAEALMREAAAARHPLACFNLALVKLNAGSEADLREAVGLLTCAAEQEVGDAQHALAVLMLEGRGVVQDVEAGADMMARAAGNGSLAGEVEFAILQFGGRGVGRDERAAARGFARAAARGNAIAQNRLARILLQGRWLPRDVTAAMGWHLAARAQGLNDALLDGEFERLSEAQRAEAAAFAQDQITAYALTRPTAQAQSTPAQFTR
jgi:hypothetical protein